MSSVTKDNAAGAGEQSGDKGSKTSVFYTDKFFRAQQTCDQKAISFIIPKVLGVIQPTSVIDVGCGIGMFLASFREHGIEDIQGIDGAYVPRELLVIPQENFMPFDLNHPLTLDRTYDLVVCLEVAEHLAPESAADFIASLTRLGSIILFSAAIPYQGGTGHLNEQWPEYWADLFNQHGFVVVDALRRGIWYNRDIHYWYRQNMLFFCSEEVLASNEKLAEAHKTTNPDALSLVHPEIYLQCNWKYSVKLRKIRIKVGRWKNAIRRSI